MVNETLKHCKKCGFAYVILNTAENNRSSVAINQCLIDGSKLDGELPEKALVAADYLTTEKYDTSHYYIIYPQIRLTEVVASDDGAVDIIQSHPYEERINNQIKDEFLDQRIDKSTESPDYKQDDWSAYNGRSVGAFGFKLENHSLRIIHYTGLAHTQMPMISIENIFSVDLGFVS